MKRFLLVLVALVIASALGVAAYLDMSPYHARLRAQIPDPAKRQAAVLTALGFEKVHLRALEGQAPQEYAMARHFATGDLGFQDADQALHWYQRAADHGDSRAELKVAACYLTGDGIRKDEAAGADWAQKASQAGNSEAQDLMGALLAGGIGGPQDFPASMVLLNKAHSSRMLQIAMDTDQKLKAIYALPQVQRDGEIKKLADAVRETVHAQFPAIVAEAVARGVVDPEQVDAE